ncbi:hypothetical protein DPMN_033860 [Dreissena polymorpha]|uniref:Uncharacterized protein n=1 Tax=Dreissena polymorpha TaxID=45954 RepID=A0A9D4M6H7_DREPO|nr:hypothetical protein DPMN_033860 [Dreissena polymorpha]
MLQHKTLSVWNWEAENYNGRGMVRGDNPKKGGRANPNPNPTPNTNPNPNPNPLTPPCAIPYHASPVVEDWAMEKREEPAEVVSLSCTKGGNCGDGVYNDCFPWTRGSAR